MCGVLPTDSLGLFSGNVDTLECALLERVYYCKVDGQFVAPPPVHEETLRERLSAVRSDIIRYVGGFAPVSYDEFVDTYKGPKRLCYERAVASLACIGVSARDAVAKAFVKREKCNVAKAPRVIQPRDPRYGASLGRFIKPLEKVLYKAMARLIDGDQIVSKGLNLDGVGALINSKWCKFRRPVALGLDATKFDMHCSKEILSWEHSVYNGIFNSSELRKLLRWQLINRGRGYADDGKIKYVVEGRRLSGDMNTSSGNCLIMCSIVIAYCRQFNFKYDLINNGDDCVLFMEEESLPLVTAGITQWFLDFGYRIVCEAPVTCIEKIEFCQMHPVLVGEEYRMVRNPKTAIEKDTFCVAHLQNKQNYQKWAAGVAAGGRAGCSGIPVMYEFYNYLSTEAVVDDVLKENSGMARLQRGMFDTKVGVSEDTRYSFYLAFGITPDAQEEIEDWFRTTGWDPEVVGTRYPGYLRL